MSKFIRVTFRVVSVAFFGLAIFRAYQAEVWAPLWYVFVASLMAICAE